MTTRKVTETKNIIGDIQRLPFLLQKKVVTFDSLVLCLAASGLEFVFEAKLDLPQQNK